MYPLDTFIISLNDIRKTEFFNTFRLYNLNPIWMKAVNGKDAVQYKNYFTDTFFRNATPHAIGCALSHLEIWKKILNEGEDNKNYFIVEDDVIMQNEDGFSKNLTESLKKVPDDYDILYLGCFGCVENHTLLNYLHKNKKYVQVNDHISIPRNVIGTHAYIVNKRGCQKLVDLFTQYKIFNAIDECLNYFLINDKLNVYVTNPILMSQTSTRKYNISSHPVIINKISSFFYVENGQIRLNYALNLPVNNNKMITYISIMYLVLGIILSFSKISILTLTKLYFLLHLVDFYWVKNWNAIFIHYFIFIFPSLLKEKSEFIKI